jgi:hypothetical protein
MYEIEVKSTVKVFGGHLIRFSHNSTSTKTVMTCAVYIPNELGRHQENKIAVIMYLSGLTCTDENVCQKSGVFRKLAEHNVISIVIKHLISIDSKTLISHRLHLSLLILLHVVQISQERRTVGISVLVLGSILTQLPSPGPPTTICTLILPRSCPHCWLSSLQHLI